MTPILILDEPSVDALLSKLHADLARAAWGPRGGLLRHLAKVPASHLRFEVFAPVADEARIRAFLQKQVAFGASASSARAEYKFLRADGQHVVKVFDRRGASNPRSAGEGLLGRLTRAVTRSGEPDRPAADALQEQVRSEMTRAVDRLTGPGAMPRGSRIRVELLHEVESWLPAACLAAEQLAIRATERLRIFHGLTAQVRISVRRPDGTQPLGDVNERLRAFWDGDASRDSTDSRESQRIGVVSTTLAAQTADPDGTLMIAAVDDASARPTFRLKVSGPKGTARVPLPVSGRVALSRAQLGAAITAVGSDARLLPRAEDRCPILELVPGEARLLTTGEHPRFSTTSGQPLRPGRVDMPAVMRVGAGDAVSASDSRVVTVRLESD